jgi:CheY-like chemotaxis protein
MPSRRHLRFFAVFAAWDDGVNLHLVQIAAQRRTIAETTPMPSQGTVLVVEDDDGIRSLLVAVSERDGFRCRTAEDGDGAIKALGDGSGDPDVILLDLVMPRVDGFTVLAHLGQHLPHLLPRVIVLTAVGESQLRKCPEIERAWCVRRKPLDIEDLRVQMLKCADR